MNQGDLIAFYTDIDGYDLTIDHNGLRVYEADFMPKYCTAIEKENIRKLAAKGILTGDYSGYRLSDKYCIDHGIDRRLRLLDQLNKLYAIVREVVMQYRNERDNWNLWRFNASEKQILRHCGLQDRDKDKYGWLIYRFRIGTDQRSFIDPGNALANWEHYEYQCQVIERAIVRCEMGLPVERVF